MKTNGKGIRVLLADDHQIFLEGLQRLLEKTFDIVGCVGDGNELVGFTQRYKPDIIITDINMPRVSGIEAVKRIRVSGLTTGVVFLTVLDDAKLVLKAFQVAGETAGYVLKSSASSELMGAIQEVLAGRSYITPRITSGVLHQCMQRIEQLPEGLTSRQTEVLRLIAEGKTMKEVASVLDISTRTAEAHKYQMMHELGIRTCAQLVQFAVSEGLVCLPGSSNGIGIGKSQRSLAS